MITCLIICKYNRLHNWSLFFISHALLWNPVISSINIFFFFFTLFWYTAFINVYYLELHMFLFMEVLAETEMWSSLSTYMEVKYKSIDAIHNQKTIYTANIWMQLHCMYFCNFPTPLKSCDVTKEKYYCCRSKKSLHSEWHYLQYSYWTPQYLKVLWSVQYYWHSAVFHFSFKFTPYACIHCNANVVINNKPIMQLSASLLPRYFFKLFSTLTLYEAKSGNCTVCSICCILQF